MTDTDDPWAEYAADWDTDEGARLYADAAHRHLSELLAARGIDLAGARVLDFGCGTGLLTERMADDAARIDAVDNSAAMRSELVGKVERLGWRHVSVHAALPDSTGAHDLVVCSSVLSFVDDLAATVAGLARRLRPGGLLVHWDWERTDDHDHGLTRSEARRALERAGLVGVTVEPAFRFQVEGTLVRPISGVGSAPS